MLIQINKGTKNFGGDPLFEQVNLVINPKEKLGLVGMNGTGKTTLLKILAGLESLDQGEVSRKKGLKVGYLEQNPSPCIQTVFGSLLESHKEIKELKKKLEQIENLMADPMTFNDELLSNYGQLQEEFDQIGGYIIESEIISVLKGLGLESKINQKLQLLSGGERVRVELARLLVSKSDVLLLDEPTNHLDLLGIEWLENYLIHSTKALIIVSHDRTFLDRVTEKTLEIEDGNLYLYPGNYSIYQNLKTEREQQIQRDFELQQREIRRLKRLVRQYRQWGLEGDNDKFFKKAKEIEHRLEKMMMLKSPIKVKDRLKTKVKQKDKSSKEIIKCDGFSKKVGDKLLFQQASFKVYKGEQIAIIGENGSGKTTFLRLINKEIFPDDGEIEVSDNTSIGYLPQVISFINEKQRIIEYAIELIGNDQKSRQELAKFGFYSSDVSKRLVDLSGGEKVRLYLMTIFQKEVNLLILDEPTNHLDIFAREEVERILKDYQGTLLTVSHDRYFLKKIFKKTILIEEKQITKIDQLLLDI